MRAALLLAFLAACKPAAPRARAQVVGSREELIGGPAALGDIGDLKLQNEHVRFIIQSNAKTPHARGWGVYAGSLVDADRVRPGDAPGSGKDLFGEFFPAYFLEAVEPSFIGIPQDESGRLLDGSDGCSQEWKDRADGKNCPAVVRVEGRGSALLSLTARISSVLVGLDPDTLDFSTDYILAPGWRYLKAVCTVLPIEDTRLAFRVPMGVVTLFGALTRMFIPGPAGFDVRFGLQKAYAAPPGGGAFPGLVTQLLGTTTAEDVSYGVAAEVNEETSYVYKNRARYPGAEPGDALVPFVASSFTALFFAQPPTRFVADEPFEFTSYFIVGDGDHGSILDVLHGIRETPTGRVEGRIIEKETGLPVDGAQVVVLDEEGNPFTQYRTRVAGKFGGTLPAGKYSARVLAPDRRTLRALPFEVTEGGAAVIKFAAEQPGIMADPRAMLHVTVTDETGRAVPAKASVVGRYAPEFSRRDPKGFLFDLTLGEPFLSTDGRADDGAQPGTLEYLEKTFLVPPAGVLASARPGKYDVYLSRGPEYELEKVEAVQLVPGQVQRIRAQLRRAFDTPGYVSADFHVHSQRSIDSPIPLEERVLSFAAEDVEFVAGSDHNFVTDYVPLIARMGLGDFVSGTTSLELTTLEMGHFNAYPLRYEPGPITKGSFDWVDLPPQGVFDGLRKLGKYEGETVVQVNHPRDGVLGYFTQFNVGPESGEARPTEDLLAAAFPQGPAWGCEPRGGITSCENATFSWDFDAIEIYTAKRQDLIRTFRMPEAPPPAPLPEKVPPAGEIVREPCTEEPCDPAFPGAAEDWFNMLTAGRAATALANSDSHGLFEEVGYPRNYVRAESRDEREIARGVRRRQVLMTNGPFLEMFVNGQPVGTLVAAQGGQVTVKLSVKSAEWARVDRCRLVVNGRDGADSLVDAATWNAESTLEAPQDLWVVAFCEGEQSLFPVVTPSEVPPLLLNEAVGAIGSAFGFGGDGMGNLRPTLIYPIKPWAMTNPIWIDANGDGVSHRVTADVLSGAPRVEGLRKPHRAPPPRRRSALRDVVRHFLESSH